MALHQSAAPLAKVSGTNTLDLLWRHNVSHARPALIRCESCVSSQLATGELPSQVGPTRCYSSHAPTLQAQMPMALTTKSPWRLPMRAVAAALTLVALVAASGCTSPGGSTPLPGLTLSSTPLPGKFVWRDLVTESPAAVKPFYAALFGWEFEERTALGAPYTLVKQDGQPIAGITQARRSVPDQPVSQWISFMSVSDVDRAAEQVRQGGGSVVLGPLDVPRIGRGAVVIDPDGAALGLLRSTAGDPIDTPSPAVNRFLWTEHLSRQPHAVAEFYARLAGLQVSKTELGDSAYWVLSSNRPRAGVMRNPTTVDRAIWLPYVRVADPAATAARAKQLGGRVLLAPRPELRNGTLALIADPTGAVLAVQKWPL